MCNPASFVLTKDRVLWSRSSDSHEDIIRENSLDDSANPPDILRVEITPKDRVWTAPVADWVYKIDQDIFPAWHDAATDEARARAELSRWAEARLIVGGSAEVRAGGTAVVRAGGTAVVRAGGTAEVRAGGTAVVRAGGTAEVRDGGTAEVMDGGTAEVMAGGTAVVRDGGTVISYGKATVQLFGVRSVWVDRSGDVPVCTVGGGPVPPPKPEVGQELPRGTR